MLKFFVVTIERKKHWKYDKQSLKQSRTLPDLDMYLSIERREFKNVNVDIHAMVGY